MIEKSFYKIIIRNTASNNILNKYLSVYDKVERSYIENVCNTAFVGTRDEKYIKKCFYNKKVGVKYVGE